MNDCCKRLFDECKSELKRKDDRISLLEAETTRLFDPVRLFWSEDVREAIKDLAQALESYDFGPGTVGHDTLKKHEKIIAEVVG